MLLGKRPRPPMKRTTSLTEFSIDLTEPSSSSQAQNPFKENSIPTSSFGPQQDQRLLNSLVSPRNIHRRHSADFIETPQFLRSCFLCKRRLVPGRDIYMYRGDSAFCSQECREQQMNHDEKKKDKCSTPH